MRVQKLAALIVAAAAILGIVFAVGLHLRDQTMAVTEATAEPIQEETPSPTPEPTPIVSTVHFSATGDDLIHDGLFAQARSRAHAEGKDGYDFTYAYENVKDFYAGFDLNWLNQETLITGACEPSGYPCFATPTDIFPTLYDVGWRAFNISTNHTNDQGLLGLTSTMEFWDSTPEDVAVSGLYDLETYDNFTYQVVNGIKFGYLSYTYGTNGISTPSDAEYGVVLTEQEDIIEQQVKAIRPNCDVLIVSCHWGTEGSHIIHETQTELAQKLADWGADLIIGTHPHMIQDAAWLTGADGHKAFVAYSLGNFINFQDGPDNLIGAVLDITIQKTENPDGSVEIHLLDPKFHGVISHYDAHYANGRVYMLEDYTEELAQSHGIRSSFPEFSLDYIRQVLRDNISEEFLELE